MRYIIACYRHEASFRLVWPVKSRSDKYFVVAYKEVYKELEAKGFKPTLNVTDIKCSKAVRNYIISQNVG